MNEAIWIVDGRTLRIVAVNDAALRMTGLPSRALLDHGITSLAATPEDLAFWADAYAGRDDRLLSDSLVRRIDGSVLPVVRRIGVVEHEGRRCFEVAMRER